MDLNKIFTYEIPQFLRDYSFYNSNIFSRYVEKCRAKVLDFTIENIISVKGDKSANLLEKLLMAAFFHNSRAIGHFDEISYLGQLVPCTEYENFFELFHDEMNTPFINQSKKIRESIDGKKQMAFDLAYKLWDDNPINSEIDFEAEESITAFIKKMASEVEDTNTNLDIYELSRIISHSFISACKLFLDGKVIFNKYNKEQINSQALPENREECYTLFNNTLVIFQFNLYAVFNSAAFDYFVNEENKKKIASYKSKAANLKNTVKEQSARIKSLELELKKKTNDEIKNIVNNNENEKIDSLNAENISLMKQISKLQKQIDDLEESNMKINTELEMAKIHLDHYKNHINEEELICDYTKKYGFVCQHETLNSKLLEAFPNSIIINKPVTFNSLNIDVMVGITKDVSHSLYGQTKQAAINANIPYVHCCEVNIDKIAECIAQTIGN